MNKFKPQNIEKFILTSTSIYVFDIVVLDTIVPLSDSNFGNKYALTLMCDLSKYLGTITIPDKSARTVARVIFENFILVYGKIKVIKSDLEFNPVMEFKNQVLSEFCKFLEIDKNFSTSHLHQTL